MKPIYPFTRTRLIKTLLAVLIILSGLSASSQVVSELVFKNPTRTGTAGAVGTVYKFASITTGIDALVTISAKSSSLVTLSSIDLTNTGYANAFQPQISYNDGDAPINTTWYMEFDISFVQSSNNAVAVTVTSFNVTALDMDGDDETLRERITFYGLNSYTLESPTSISVSNVTGGKVFTGSYDDYSNINTSATNLMVTNKYVNTNNFKMRIGGTNGSHASNKSERMSSLWFKSFTYNNPVVAALPVNLLSFFAKKDNKGVILDWATSMEKDFSHFVVERSTDGRSFDEIATIFTDGNNSTSAKSYSYTDKSETAAPVIYYRLKMVDVDARYKYSEVRVIRNSKNIDQAAVTIFPNPAVSELKVTVPAAWQNKAVTYSIYSSNGAIVKQKITGQAAQTEFISLAGMKPGIYILKAGTAEEAIVKQFAKQ